MDISLELRLLRLTDEPHENRLHSGQGGSESAEKPYCWIADIDSPRIDQGP